MHTKLTLRIEENLIERVKSYSQRKGQSVSQLFADYIKMLPDPEDAVRARRSPPLTPIVRSLVGVLEGAQVDEEDYRRYLEEKHR